MAEKLKGMPLIEPRLSIYGRESIKIENIDGIASLCDSSLSVKCRNGLILAEGEGLEISYMQEGVVVIFGKINSVSFA